MSGSLGPVGDILYHSGNAGHIVTISEYGSWWTSCFYKLRPLNERNPAWDNEK